MAQKQYRWDSPYEWLEEKAKEWNNTRLLNEFLAMARDIGSDYLQDSFQSEMDADGYFKPLIPQASIDALIGRSFTIDDEPIDDMAEFLNDSEFEPEALAEILALEVGQDIAFGGGAFAEFTIRRIG